MISLSLKDAASAMQAVNIDQLVNDQFSGVSTDTRTVQPGNLFFALQGPNFDGHDYAQAALEKGALAVVTHRAIDTPANSTIKVKDTREALGLLARSWRQQFKGTVIGITGSNGKTTVKEMLSAILQECGAVLATKGNLNNDIGVPLTLFNLVDEDFAVIEMGANHVGEIAQLAAIAEPDIGVVTLCAPAHLEGFGSVENVAKTKGEMFSGLASTGTAVINADDPFVGLWNDLAAHCTARHFGFVKEAEVRAENLQLAASESTFDLIVDGEKTAISLPLAGTHNVMNALAASACGVAAGASARQIQAGLAKMQSVPGRLQFKPVNPLITVIDDTYNANPRSMQAGIAVLMNAPGQHWLIVGDMGELGEGAEIWHAELGEQARQQGVDRLYCVGELSAAAAGAFGTGAHHFTQQEKLIDQLQQDLSGEITLLIKGSRSAHMETVVNALTGSQ